MLYRAYILSLFMSLMALWSSGASLRPERLRVEHLERPTIVAATHPRLSWTLRPTSPRGHDAAQTAYRLVVTTDSTLLERPNTLRRGMEGLIWDSGRVPSSQSHLVPYAGQALEPATDYYWRVMAWDEKGRPSQWSALSSWGTPPNTALWQASWIGPWWRDERSRRDLYAVKQNWDKPSPLLRKEFALHGPVKKAKIYASGLGWMELRLNGNKIGNDLLAPDHTDYGSRPHLSQHPINHGSDFTGHRVMYMAYDVSDMLRQGPNALGAMLGNGFYDPFTRWDEPYGSPRLLCQLDIEYADGTHEIVASDTTWMCTPGPIVKDGPFVGEVYDARREQPGWDLPGFDASSWRRAHLRRVPGGVLVPQEAPASRVTATYKPLRLEQQPDSSIEVYFPEEISGWVRLHGLPTTDGQEITLTYRSESPLGEGRYTARGSTTDYAPRFTWYVFSQVNVKGATALTADNITAEAVNTPLERTGHFSSSIPLLDSIDAIWRRSLLDNAHSNYISDCPHRERTAYTGDAQVTMCKTLDTYNAAALYRKWLEDMRLAQNPVTGYVPNAAPLQPSAGGGVGWGAAMSLMPWDHFMAYGDTAVLRDNYPAMLAQARQMLRWLTPRGTMWAHRGNAGDPEQEEEYWMNLGDWCAPGDSVPAREAVHTFFLWRCWDRVARAATVLGHSDDVAEATAHVLKARRAFHQAFYDADTHSYGPRGASVFALEMGAVPESLRQAVVDALAREITQEHGSHIHTGMFAARYMLEQLGRSGHQDLALTMMQQRTYPSFGYMLANGAKTTWEQWNGQNSHNHPMFGGTLCWLANTLVGVRVLDDGAGWRHWEVRPARADSAYTASYDLDTPYGLLKATYTSDPAGNALDITVPVGTTAEAYLPRRDGTILHRTLTQGRHHLR